MKTSNMNNCKFSYNINKALAKSEKRKVIVHKHIFKNAGTTFDWILEKNFGSAFYDHRDNDQMQSGREKYLIEFLNDNPGISALSSHHIWFRFSHHKNIELIPVFFIRHPIERILSVYNFEKKQEHGTLGAHMAKKMNFKDYVAWRMLKDTPATIRNFQTRMICGLTHNNEAKRKHLKIALQEIQDNPFTGMVEYFKESLLLFDPEFKKRGFNLNLSYKAKNVNQPIENVNYDIRANRILEDLNELAGEVLEKNALDIELYNTTKIKFEKKLQHQNT